MAIVVSATRKRQEAPARLRRLPKLTAPLLRLNGLCPYYTMFPLSFPFDALANSKAGEWVLDPFCGRGTTILAARLRGLPSVGVDSNPIAGPSPPPSCHRSVPARSSPSRGTSHGPRPTAWRR